jgi:branched-chain amino acid transport system ATP-binding protein
MLLELANISSCYGRIQALHDVSLGVGDGELVALVGANGAGKTTLLRAISGVQPLTAGAIRFDGHDISRLSAEKRVEAGILQVPEGRQVFGPLSVEDNLRLGAYRRHGRNIAADIDAMYAMFPILKQKRLQAAGTLSGGQQQMLAIARALMGKPRLLLLDEPSMGLAPLLVAEIFKTVEALKAEGTTILMAEQNAYAALAIADRGYVLETGDMVLADSGAALLADDKIQQAYLGL